MNAIAHSTDPGPLERRTAPRPFGIAVTAIGLSAAIASLGFGAGAALVASLSLAVSALSFAIAARGLRGITVRVETPARADVGEAFPVRLFVRTLRGERDVLVDLRGGGGRSDRCVWIPRLGPGRSALRAEHVAQARGRCARLSVELVTSFPFGMFEAKAQGEFPVELLVRPRRGGLRRLQNHLGSLQALDARARPASAGEGEFVSLREWRAGEGLRRIAYKASARRGRLVVREESGARPLGVWIVLPCAVSAFKARSFEVAVRLAASLVRYFHARGHEVLLSIGGGEWTTLASARGRGGDSALLDALAEARPVTGAPAVSRAPAGFGARADRRGLIVLGGARRPDGPRAGSLVLDVDDPRTRRWLREDCGWRDVR